jgi:fimbrial chaperone protein
MRSLSAAIGAIVITLFGSNVAAAASLRVTPVTLDLPAPDNAGTLHVHNEARRSINVQVRVFRWTQSRGEDRLAPATDVVASPPMIAIGAGADNVVRIVRVAKSPVVAEEDYRVVVDELPDPTRRHAGVVNLVLRYSVPVFFHSTDASRARVSWSIRRRGKALAVTAKNSGDQRFKIADLALTDSRGRSIVLRKGLVGYVLGHATMQWSFPARGSDLSARTVTLSALSDHGRITATVHVAR